MLTETLFNTKQAREASAQIMFEENKVSSLLIALQGLLSLYSVGGRLTGNLYDRINVIMNQTLVIKKKKFDRCHGRAG